MKILLLGWGNPDRQDDGAAWHVLAEVSRRFSLPVPEEFGESFEPWNGSLEMFFALQLTPELAEMIADFDKVAFIDAHTGALPEDLSIRRLQPYFQASPLTHHLTAESCLELADKLYHASPEAWLVSIRGYEFGFARQLSPKTERLVHRAAGLLVNWIDQGTFAPQD